MANGWKHRIRLTSIQTSSAPYKCDFGIAGGSLSFDSTNNIMGSGMPDNAYVMQSEAIGQAHCAKETCFEIDLANIPNDNNRTIDVLRFSSNNIWHQGTLHIPEEKLKKRNGFGKTLNVKSDFTLGKNEVWAEWGVSDSEAITIAESNRTKAEILIEPPQNLFNWIYDGKSPTDPLWSEAPKWWSDELEWGSFVRGNFSGNSYEDLAFNMHIPFLFSDIDQSSQGAQSVRDVYAKITPSYNFYIQSYEDTLANFSVPTTLLPNVYVFMSELDKRFLDNENSRFKKHIDLYTDDGNVLVESMFEDIVVIKRTGERCNDEQIGLGSCVKIGEEDEGQYFDKWSKAINRLRVNYESLDNLQNSYRDTAFPMSNLDFVKDAEGKQRLFPMNIKIDFVTDVNTKFADALKSAKLSSTLIKKISQSHAQNPFGVQLSFENWNNVDQEACDLIKEFQTLEMWDLDKWLDSSPKMSDMIADNPVFYGRVKEEVEAAEHPDASLFVLLMKEFFKLKVNEIVKQEKRTFKNILDGDLAYSETLLYRVEKYEDENYVQSFWFPNSSDIDVLSYVDTQVKYNIPYSYKIYAYQLVVGNEYEYQTNEVSYFSEWPAPFEPPEPRHSLADEEMIDTQTGEAPTTQEGGDAGEAVAEAAAGLTAGPSGFTGLGFPPTESPATSTEEDSSSPAAQNGNGNTSGNGLRETYAAGGDSITLNGDSPTTVSPGADIVESNEVISTSTSDSDLDPFQARLCVFNMPSLRLIKVPYYFSEWDNPRGIIVKDSPPIPPNVSIMPYLGTDDKVMIWLNGAVGDFWAEDIQFGGTEVIDRSRFVKNSKGEIHFKSDDPASVFEVFRIKERPKSFADFALSNPIRIFTKGSNASSFVDKGLKPNQKYYYTFRAIDVHEHISNPTPVYEVELVKSEENIYTLVNTIDMGTEPERQISKCGRKFIQIKPSFLQTALNENVLSKIQNKNNIQQDAIKNPGETVWNSGADNIKKFKVRLSSKKSGKKMDINLRFKIIMSEAPKFDLPAKNTLPTVAGAATTGLMTGPYSNDSGL